MPIERATTPMTRPESSNFCTEWVRNLLFGIAVVERGNPRLRGRIACLAGKDDRQFVTLAAAVEGSSHEQAEQG
jgi:hypothetical protein